MTFDWNANWPFLLQVTLLGMGLQKLISKWIPNSLPFRLLYLLDNVETRVVLTQPLNHHMPVLRNVSRDLQVFVRTNWPTCLQVDLHAKKTKRKYAKNVTNLKLLTYVDCKVTSSISEDSPESRAIIPIQTDIKTWEKWIKLVLVITCILSMHIQ
jgi:hypothetical protein